MIFPRNCFPLTLIIILVAHAAHLQSCASGHSALPGNFRVDKRSLVDSSRWPWQAIGTVQRRIGGVCTGTLIAPMVVLTAAHCTFDQRNGQPLQPSDLRFLPSGWIGKNPQMLVNSGTAGIVRTSPGHGQHHPTIKNMATD
jgi:hypothetical protein